MQLCTYVKNASGSLSVQDPPQISIAGCLELQGLTSRLRDSRKALSRFYPARNHNQIEFPLLIPNESCDPLHDGMFIPNARLGSFIQLKDTCMLSLRN